MKYWRRNNGSQRTSKPQSITFEPNFAGQGGFDYMAFFDGIRYHCIQPETIEEVRQLQSQAAILALTIKEPK